MNEIRVDGKLTPENCKDNGFEWWKDAIYDSEAPVEVNSEFIELINKGWKLGKSASKELEQNGGIGIYKPLKAIST